MLFAQRVMEIAERLQDPRLVAAVLQLAEALESLRTDCGIGGYSGHHEFEARFAVGLHVAVALRGENFLPAGDFAHRQLQRHHDLILLGKCETFYLLLTAPDAFQPSEALGSERDVAEGREVSGLLAGGLRTDNVAAEERLHCGGSR